VCVRARASGQGRVKWKNYNEVEEKQNLRRRGYHGVTVYSAAGYRGRRSLYLFYYCYYYGTKRTAKASRLSKLIDIQIAD
jgi:hypothetical protein